MTEQECQDAVSGAIQLALGSPHYGGPIVGLYGSADGPIIGIRDQEGETGYVLISVKPTEPPDMKRPKPKRESQQEDAAPNQGVEGA